MSTNLQIVMLHHVRQDLQYVDLGCKFFTLILAPIPQGKIHQQGRRVLHRVVAEVVLTALEDLHDPRDDTALDHTRLGALTQAKLLERPECVLAQVGVITALLV